MPLVYEELPSYTVLSVFAAGSLPFSIKFLIAPFVEKYTIISYGKRKTWIVSSQLVCGTILFCSSFYTAQVHEYRMGVLMVATVFFIALQDISLDALAIKELKIPNLVGILSTVSQTIGGIFGSFFLLKMTSKEFALTIGLEEAISTPSVILKFFGLFFKVF